MEDDWESPWSGYESSSLLCVLWALEDDMVAGVEVWVGVCVRTSECVVGPGTEMLGVMCIEAVSCGDTDDGGCDDAGVCFEGTSNCCDRFAIVRWLTC